VQRELNASAPEIPHLLRRIAGLFAPFRAPLIATAALVITSAGLTVIPPLLIEVAFNQGLFPKTGGPNLSLLASMVVLMIAIWILSAGLGVGQTYLTQTVGNKVMGVLRVRLFSHLQSMELAFFTRTKTGIIQSRLQNDVGGVAGVLSNTVSTVLGNTVTVLERGQVPRVEVTEPELIGMLTDVRAKGSCPVPNPSPQLLAAWNASALGQ
jgi:ATP-binding cassette subfamily B protein